MDSLNYQTRAIAALTRELPLNDFGLPAGVYRTDLLPWHEYVDPTAPKLAPVIKLLDDPSAGVESEVLHMVEHEQRIAGFPTRLLEPAFMWLNYHEGFPSQQNGHPFWGILNFEPQAAYDAFQEYLQMHQGRAAVDQTNEGEDYGTPASGVRSVQILAQNQPGDNVLLAEQEFGEYYHLYYWGMRAKAYDIFRTAQHRHQQEIRAIETEDNHFITANRLMNRLMEYMDDEEEFWDLMTPKVGLDMLKQVTQLQRVSVGLGAMGPAGNGKQGEAPKSQTMELTLRQVAQEQHITLERGDTGDDDKKLLSMLEDPETASLLQRLVLNVNSGDDNG
jgi:hypothetical protein